MKKVRIAVFVSGNGSNLRADAYALSRAALANIPSAVVSRKEFSDTAEFEKKIESVLREFKIDLIVLAGYMTILSADFVKKYPERIINVHPSLIPSFCGKGYYGLRVHEAALNYGVKVTGATVHFVNEVPDGGRIILQKSVMIRKGETPESLQTHVMRNAEWIILPRAVEMVAKMIAKGGELEE